MDTKNFPESTGSSKLAGVTNGSTTGMDMDPVGDSTNSKPMTDTGNGSQAQESASSPRPSGDRLKSMAHDTVDKMADLADRYSGSPNKAIEASKTLMKDKPMVALGAAVVFGLLLGRLTSR